MFEVRKTEGYAKWLDSLRDGRARARVLVRIERLAAGNPGDKKQGRRIVVLLAGGDKRTQSADVKTALRLARNL